MHSLEVSEIDLNEKLKQSTFDSRKEIEDLKFQHSKLIQELKSSKEFEVDTLSAQVAKRDTLIKELREQIEEMKNVSSFKECKDFLMVRNVINLIFSCRT